MSRNMLKWRSWRKYSRRDMPYARLEDSWDATDGGYLKKHTIKTKSLRNIRSSDKPKGSTRSLRRRSVTSIARDCQSNEIPRSGTGGSENSSFLTISLEELNFEDSYTRSDASAMENKQSQCGEQNTFRKLSKNSKASMAKMSSKWCKFRDSFVSLRKPSLPEVVDNQRRRPKKEDVKPDATISRSSKDRLELIEQTNCCYENTLLSNFPTGCNKLNRALSPDITFDGEGALHSTLIKQRKDQKADKRKVKKLKGSMKTLSLPKVRRRRGKDSLNFRKLSVRSSGSKVEVKISLTLSDSGNNYSSTSSETNKCYLNSPIRTVDLTPVLPKRPLSRRSLFSDESNVTQSVAYKQTQLCYDEAKCNDRIIVQNLTAAPSVEENRTYLSPGLGEIGEDELITPPSRQISVSIAKIGKGHRRERKPRGVIVASGNNKQST